MHHLYTILVELYTDDALSLGLVDQVKSYFKLSVIIFAHLLRAGFFSSWDDPFDAFGSEKESKTDALLLLAFAFPLKRHLSSLTHKMVVLVKCLVKVFSMMDMAFITAPHRSIDDQ